MLPFLEVPIAIGNGDVEKIVTGKIQPINITAYHEGFNPDVGMFVYIGEQPIQLAMSLSIFEQKLIAYWKLVNERKASQIKVVN